MGNVIRNCLDWIEFKMKVKINECKIKPYYVLNSFKISSVFVPKLRLHYI